MKEGDEDMNGIWEMKKFVRDGDVKEITLLRPRCSVMAKTGDTVTETRDKHLHDDITSTNTFM